MGQSLYEAWPIFLRMHTAEIDELCGGLITLQAVMLK